MARREQLRRPARLRPISASSNRGQSRCLPSYREAATEPLLRDSYVVEVHVGQERTDRLCFPRTYFAHR